MFTKKRFFFQVWTVLPLVYGILNTVNSICCRDQHRNRSTLTQAYQCGWRGPGWICTLHTHTVPSKVYTSLCKFTTSHCVLKIAHYNSHETFWLSASLGKGSTKKPLNLWAWSYREGGGEGVSAQTCLGDFFNVLNPFVWLQKAPKHILCSFLTLYSLNIPPKTIFIWPLYLTPLPSIAFLLALTNTSLERSRWDSPAGKITSWC